MMNYSTSLLIYYMIFLISSVLLLQINDLKSNEENVTEKWDSKLMQEIDKNHQRKHQSYFIHTKGCRMPSFPAVDKDIETFLNDERHVQCGKPLIRSNHSYLWIDLNETEIENEYGIKEIEDLQCQYNSIKRLTDFKNEYGKLNHTFKFGDVVEVNDEFIYVSCHLKSTNKQIFEDYHFFVPNKQKQSIAEGEPHSNENNRPMSVMVLGIDSVSRLNFHRQMSKSADVLLNDLKAIELFGFNKVADNTYPNMMPVLSGLNENELATACMQNKNPTFDKCNFIWKDFKEKNFTTVYTEDVAYLGLFQYLRPGFVKQPTDFSLRPILIEMEKHIGHRRNFNTFFCMGKRRSFDILMEYAQKFTEAMAQRLHFSIFWGVTYSHDRFNDPKLIDTTFADLLRRLKSTRALDNTFLIVMSDHGFRWGPFRKTYQGMIEERQPFVYLVPPKRFSKEYPEAMRNLVKNRRALTTHFDLYETFRDLANLKMIKSQTITERAKRLQETDSMPRGISLFLPIPESRTCSSAAIVPHWCTCHEHIELKTTDTRITEAAQIVINHINDLLKPYPQCHPLMLNSIIGGNLGESNNNTQNGISSFVHVTVRLETKPGLSEFEATTRIHDNNRHELTGTISRINLYGKQSHCIDDYNLKLYCYCNDQI